MHLLKCSTFSMERMWSIAKTLPSWRVSSWSSTAIRLKDSSSTTVTRVCVFVVEIFFCPDQRRIPTGLFTVDMTQSQLWNIGVPYVKTNTSSGIGQHSFTYINSGRHFLSFVLYSMWGSKVDYLSYHFDLIPFFTGGNCLRYCHSFVPACCAVGKLEGILRRFRNRDVTDIIENDFLFIISVCVLLELYRCTAFITFLVWQGHFSSFSVLILKLFLLVLLFFLLFGLFSYISLVSLHTLFWYVLVIHSHTLLLAKSCCVGEVTS